MCIIIMIMIIIILKVGSLFSFDHASYLIV